MGTPVPIPTPSPSKLPLILSIIKGTLAALGSVVPGEAVAVNLLGVFQAAMSLYQQETGKPFDITKIPFEAKV